MVNQKSKWYALIPLFMLVLIDVAGIIIVLPVLTPLLLSPNSSIVQHASPFMRDFLYGLTLALFPLCMFFSAPILGELSDKFGRKKILLICLLITAVTYVLGAMGIIFKNFFIILISRALSGLAAGTQPIATAAIIDFSTPATKTRYLSWVVMMTSLGVIIGPALGGLTAEKSLVSWFDYQVPFFIAAILALLNAVLLFFTYDESAPLKNEQELKLTKGFVLFIQAFKNKQFTLLSILYFCYNCAWCLYYQNIPWFFLEIYHYSVAQIGLFIAYIGVVSTFIGIVTHRILSLFKYDISAFLFFVALMAGVNIVAAVSTYETAQWVWALINASCDVLCFTIALAMFSNLADRESQGWIMGVTGSIGSLTWGVGGLISGPLGYINIRLPWLTAGILCFISFFLMLAYRQTKKSTVS